MTLKAYIRGMRIMILVLLAALGAVIFYVDPENSGVLGMVLFYVVAFFVLSAIFNLFLLFIRRLSIGQEMAAESVGLNMRQSLLLSLLGVGMLFLQSLGLLVWWNALLAVAGVFLIELYFLSRS